ncbi:hypothetical protein LLEC1_01865 [Akanthomyces lecanii]|uniref:Uncharacterized protein n=1 Tax=Cordyceps confragosa TaxID=2714763 RepID=A0A179I3F4_CORDF|nr:hypothetical protein LLEC1_01865 [Akanthomyces lecanii]
MGKFEAAVNDGGQSASFPVRKLVRRASADDYPALCLSTTMSAPCGRQPELGEAPHKFRGFRRWSVCCPAARTAMSRTLGRLHPAPLL